MYMLYTAPWSRFAYKGGMIITFFDCETDGLPTGCDRRSDGLDFRNVQVTVACAMNVEASLAPECAGSVDLRHSGRAVCWRDGPVAEGKKGPFEELLGMFDNADMIVAHNGHSFDMAALEKYYERDCNGRYRYGKHIAKLNDTLRSIRQHLVNSFDYKCSLEALLKANDSESRNEGCGGGQGSEQIKSGCGAKAVRLWHDGTAEARRELESYCMHDVELLIDLCFWAGAGASLTSAAATNDNIRTRSRPCPTVSIAHAHRLGIRDQPDAHLPRWCITPLCVGLRAEPTQRRDGHAQIGPVFISGECLDAAGNAARGST